MVVTGRTVEQLASVADGRLVGDPAITVRDITHDSRQVGPGTMFVAVVGENHDGHRFVDDAVALGAPALLVQHQMNVDIPQIVVEDARAAMAPVAAEVHDNPSQKLSLIGVTGTNGKTTVTHMVESIVAAAGKTPGLIGTVHTRVGAENIPNSRTTPEATDFQRLLATMVDMGAEVVAAEVSSHALTMHRVDATRFSLSAFTNLSQDHLDFHGDMERYFAAKATLFEPSRSDQAVVFIDDPAGARLAEDLEIPATTVGNGGDVFGRNVRVGLDGSSFTLVCAEGEAEVSIRLGGSFNVDNALVAAGCALGAGIPLEAVARGLSGLAGVPGRFEVVSVDEAIRVLVDYAHTPAGISEAIAAVRKAGSNRVVAVIGAGGNRDRSKRPQMGAAAAAADEVVVTSDNPRDEDPESILDQVMSGVPPETTVRRQVDRREAITSAILDASDGDVVLILGRGHERGQEVGGGRSHPFDDRQVAREALTLRKGSSA